MACGQGDYDWARLVQHAHEAGYNNALTVEFVAPLDRTPANPYKNALGTADAELTPEQLKFIQDHGSGVLSDEFYSWLVEVSANTLRTRHEGSRRRRRRGRLAIVDCGCGLSDYVD